MAPAILLVDDQRDILRLLHSALDTLRDPDLEIFEAISGEAALRLIGDQHVDLLVTDYNLPGITGTELMRQARLGLPDLPAIVITGEHRPQGPRGDPQCRRRGGLQQARAAG